MRTLILFTTVMMLAIGTNAMAADMGKHHSGGQGPPGTHGMSTTAPHGAHGAMNSPDPSKADYSTTRWSDQRRFRVSYVPSKSAPAINTLQSWTITLTDRTGRSVPDAVIEVDGDMPEHEHGLPTEPQVRSLGEGKYLLEGLKFHMPGWWVVKLDITAAGTTDEASFNLKLQ
jgi:hypothetical protein